MEVFFILIVITIVSAVLIGLILIVGLALLDAEPPSPQQHATEAKHKIEYEKERAMTEIDAITEYHKRRVFELLVQANRQMVEEQAEQARRHAQWVVARALKER